MDKKEIKAIKDLAQQIINVIDENQSYANHLALTIVKLFCLKG